MQRRLHFLFTGVAILGIVGLFASFTPTTRTYAVQSHAPFALAGHRCIVAGGSGDGTFVRNFNPYNSGLDFTQGAIYEPLLVLTTAGGGHRYNWLASKLQWSKDGKTLFITARPGVKWSDGKPLTNKDILFSLTAGKIDKAMDKIGYTNADTNIASIKLAGKDQVAIRLKTRDSTFLSTINNQFVVPEHIWAHMQNPTKSLNPNPVGTGPFNKIARFTGQDYVLQKNPHYWMAGHPLAPCLERVAAASNDASLLQMLSAEVDWTHNFVPDAEHAYDAKSPKYFHHFYATNNLPIGLFFDVTKYPYSLVGFRKGLSMAIDRQKVYKVAEYGYEPPSDALGMKYIWPKWIDPKVAAQGKTLTTYNPANAKKVLEAAGFTYKDGALVDPKGTPVSFDLHVIGGWSDWVLAMQILSKNFQDIGISANVKLDPDQGTWQPQADKGSIVHLHWNYGGGPTPYGFFFSHLAKGSFVPSGQTAVASGDWEHYWSPEGNQLLKQFRQTLNKTQQHAIMSKIESLFLKQYPFIPVMVGASWSTYSTKYFVGWPTPKDFYANPIFTTNPDVVVPLTRIAPAK